MSEGGREGGREGGSERGIDGRRENMMYLQRNTRWEMDQTLTFPPPPRLALIITGYLHAQIIS